MRLSQQYLFVYGTLMQTAGGALGTAERERLFAQSRHIGSATISGAALYDLGEYPGLSDTADTLAVVHGEVVELSDPDRTFAWLDHYEGLGPQAEYKREIRRVRADDGREIEAWVYLLRRTGDPAKRIGSGRWRNG
jgi:gamma-glutamylcyclotransferase (GGCT)/AIG2-like uncharacterized protein YtfP